MLKDDLKRELTSALKSGDRAKVDTLRFLISDINKFEIDAYPPGSEKKLTDEDVLRVIKKQVKNHEESITAFTKGGRQDLVDKETAELKILKIYLPQEMSDQELEKIISEVVKSGINQFGQIMGIVMKKVAGRAGGDRVADLVKKTIKEV
jgi:hypothetical protein